MTQKEIVEGNVLIAEFYGFKKDDNNFFFIDGHSWQPISLRFHLDYNWLYPILEKISEVEYVADIEITPTVTNIYADKTFCHFGDFLTAPWQCAVDFIKWHNTINDK